MRFLFFLFLIFNLCFAFGEVKKKVILSTLTSSLVELDQKLISLINVNNSKELKKALRNQILDINKQDSNGSTLLHFAAKQKSYESIAALLESGANQEIYDLSKTIPLHIVARNCDLKSFKLLERKSENLDLQNEEGYSSLMYACLSECFEIVEILSQKKANIELKNKNDKSVIDLVNGLKNFETRQKIMSIFDKNEILSPKN